MRTTVYYKLKLAYPRIKAISLVAWVTGAVETRNSVSARGVNATVCAAVFTLVHI